MDAEITRGGKWKFWVRACESDDLADVSDTRLLCIPDFVLVRCFLQNIIRYTDEGNI
jgi:hypothetical protein